MSQRYNDNTRRLKLKENQRRNLKRAMGPGKRAAGVTYLREYNQKSCCIFPLKVAATFSVVHGRVQLEHKSHIVKVSVEATC